jgi:adenine-specific DNA-methyltransferase
MPTLNFKGKAVIETYHHTVPHHRLEFDEKLSLLPKGQKPSLDGNLIIEGDNLLALKALLPTHAGKIKCIYIDPPYNTGNEGWVYNDNLTQPQFKEWIGKTVGKEGEDATRHDKWCCMMWPRLELLRLLLSEEGTIWVSIDDNEVHHLRMIMDQIFGEENFITQIAWQKKYTQSNDAEFFSNTHDHLLVYAKQKDQCEMGLLERTEEANARYKNPDNDERGGWKPIPLHAKSGTNTEAYKFSNGRKWAPPPGTFRRYSNDTMKRLESENRIWWGESGNAVPQRKKFLSEVRKGILPKTVWLYDEAGSNDDAKSELKAMVPDNRFPSPKPVKLLERIVRLSTDDDDWVLDSYAGSGTTGHATLKFASDGGRKFILVQQEYDSKKDEDERFNIFERVLRPRLKTAIRGYTDGKQRIAGLGGSLTCFRLGAPLFGEYRDLGEKLPQFEELAKYIFYTETSSEIDMKKVDEKTGFIGSTDAAGGTSYYLFYTPNNKEDRELSTETLKTLLKKDKNKTWVIYCEKIWLHEESRRKFERDHGKRVRPMLVPFNLK